MRFVPTHCDGCSRSALVGADRIHEGVAICGCGETAPVLPGESYSEQDAALFTRLATTVHEAALTPSQAGLLALELAPRNRVPPGRCLRRIAQGMPSLGILDLLVAGEPTALHKAEGMLATLLDAIARGHRDSGIVQSPQASSKAGSRS